MGASSKPIRERAILRLVATTVDDGLVTVDALVAASDGTERWGHRGTPVTLRLELPDAGWMAEALAQLLIDWAAEDAMVEAIVVTTNANAVARITRDDSVVSLGLLPPRVDRAA